MLTLRLSETRHVPDFHESLRATISLKKLDSHFKLPQY